MTAKKMSNPQLIPAWVDGALVPVEKLEVHQRGLRHLAVSVFVVAGAEVLLQRRAAGKYHTPRLWTNACCTHPMWDEAASRCATRRLREELGITGLAPVHRGTVEYRADVGGGLTEHELVEIFVARSDRDLALSPDPTEVMDTRWVDRATLERDIATDPAAFTPWLRVYMSDHAGLIFG